MSSPVTFPPPLLSAYRSNKLAVLAGSGLSRARDVTGSLPRWSELPDRLLDRVEEEGVWTQREVDARRASLRVARFSLEGMLAELDAIKEPLFNARKYQAALNAIFCPKNARPGEVHRALVGLAVPILATTNFDELIEHVESRPARRVYTWTEADKVLGDVEDDRKVLFKIHGTAANEDTVVMTRREYDRAAADGSYQRVMSLLLQSYTFLLVGYGVADPLELDLVFKLNAKAFGSAARTHYVLMMDASQTDRDRWQREMNLQTVPYQDHDDLSGILRTLANARQNPP